MGDAIALSASDTMGGEGVLPSIPLPPPPPPPPPHSRNGFLKLKNDTVENRLNTDLH